MTSDAGQEIRKLADEYAALTGHMPFSGTEHRGTVNVYMFDDNTFTSSAEALGHMRTRLAAVRQAAADAMRDFSCPFCGREAGRPCMAMSSDYLKNPRDLNRPHDSRISLLTETDPAIRGSFAKKKG